MSQNIIGDLDHTQFYCKECKLHGYDAVASGVCYHPEVEDLARDGQSIACSKIVLRDELK